MRTFISIHPDEETIAKISLIQRALKDRIRSTGDETFRAMRWESMDKFHITIFFIGENEKNVSEKIDERLSLIKRDIGEINICTGKINAFPNLRYPRVLVLEMIEKEGKLIKLVDEIRLAMLEFGMKEDKPFRPHVTLARVRRDSKVSITGIDTDIDNQLDFTAKSFCLYQSILQPTGAVYKKLNEYFFTAN